MPLINCTKKNSEAQENICLDIWTIEIISVYLDIQINLNVMANKELIQKYSNSGKTMTETTYIFDDDFTLEISEKSQATNSPHLGKKIFKKTLPITEKEIKLFNEKKLEHSIQEKTRKEKLNNIKEQQHKKKEAFLDSTLIDNIKFRDIYQDVIDEAYDEIDASIKTISLAVLCLKKAGILEGNRREENEDHYPTLANGELVISTSREAFYILVKNKIEYIIECDDYFTDNDAYCLNYTDFNFKVKRP